ncbi:hypothetical protein DPMN_159381 [Dreissena polymorpha]|uniref:Uncharacterized protein n=1 Tax=Dreissena polymorpha TaxID=45954 RepID=A0A9D4IP53_DREPO|nr:hypothetical protein DPMN_159381 [Dreissena polymorpha]
MLSNSLRAYQNFFMNENPRRGRERFTCNFRGPGRFMRYGNPHYGNPDFNTRGYGGGRPWRGLGRSRPSATCLVPQTKNGR